MKQMADILPEHKVAIIAAIDQLRRQLRAQRGRRQPKTFTPAPAPAATAASGNKPTAA